IVNEDVVAAAGGDVCAAGGAHWPGVAAEEQALASVAPPPVVLTGGLRLDRERVVAAARGVVGSAGGADRPGGAAEEQALAFVTPPPANLCQRVGIVCSQTARRANGEALREECGERPERVRRASQILVRLGERRSASLHDKVHAQAELVHEVVDEQ